MSRRYFFKPRIGARYEQGFHGAKTLILGAHFYCSYSQCPFHSICTQQTDIHEMDTRCPVYQGKDSTYYSLSNSCEIEIESFLEGERYYSYKLLTFYLLKLSDSLSETQKRDFWEQVAFTNYCQHYLPDEHSPAFDENPSLYEADYPAFEALLEELQPDCIFVWSEPVKRCLQAHAHVQYLGKLNIQTLTVHLFSYGKRFQKLVNYLDLMVEQPGENTEKKSTVTTADIRAMLHQLDLTLPFLPYSLRDSKHRLKQTGRNSFETFLKKSVTKGILIRQGDFLGFTEMPAKFKEYYYSKLKKTFDIPNGKVKALSRLFHYTFNNTRKYSDTIDSNSDFARKIEELTNDFLAINLPSDSRKK